VLACCSLLWHCHHWRAWWAWRPGQLAWLLHGWCHCRLVAHCCLVACGVVGHAHEHGHELAGRQGQQLLLEGQGQRVPQQLQRWGQLLPQMWRELEGALLWHLLHLLLLHRPTLHLLLHLHLLLLVEHARGSWHVETSQAWHHAWARLLLLLLLLRRQWLVHA
jgi:hypothetical protein